MPSRSTFVLAGLFALSGACGGNDDPADAAPPVFDAPPMESSSLFYDDGVVDQAFSLFEETLGAQVAVRFTPPAYPAYIDAVEIFVADGFGVPTTKNMSPREYALYRLLHLFPRPPSPGDMVPMDRFLGEVVEALRGFCTSRGFPEPALLVEPGRFLVSRAQLLLTRVHAVKRRTGGPDYVVTDSGRLTLTFPTEFEYHEMFVAGRPAARPTALYHVMGRLCTSSDWMARNRLLPEIEAGDIVAIMDAGAYFSSCSTNFAFPRPAVVLVEGGQDRVLRAEESFEHLVKPDGL